MSWTHLRDTTPKARKTKVCYLCERHIEKGEIHVVRTGTDDGTIIDTPTHTKCSAIADEAYVDEWQWESHDAFEFREEYLTEQTDKPA